MRSVGPAALCGLVGLYLALRPMFVSRFADVPGNTLDSRLVNYLLEHGYRTLVGARDWQGFWNPPFFYPARNVAAYTELFLGTAPLYWIWRLLGWSADGSFQLWLVCMVLLNFSVCFLWLRDCVVASSLGASFGAFLFAFSSARMAQIPHPQLQTHFLSVVAIHALCRLSRATEASRRENDRARAMGSWSERGWLALFFAALSAQLYAGFYLGWFLLLGLLLFASWAMVLRESRIRLLRMVEPHRGWIALLVAASALSLAPMLVHYLGAARELGLRSYAKEVAHYVPRAQTWLYMGDGSWLYGWMNGLAPWRNLESPQEQAMGLGFLTSILVLLGLWSRRREPFVPPLVLAAGSLIVLVTSFDGRVTLWRFVAPWIPGAMAIRAISRIGLLLLVPGAVGLASFLGARRAWLAAGLGLLCILEQARDVPAYHRLVERQRIDAIVEQLAGRSCAYFYFSPVLATVPGRSTGSLRFMLDWFERQHVDAMWAGMSAAVPTINGFSGNGPPGWEGLEFGAITSPRDEERLDKALARWIRLEKLDPAGLCWIKLPETIPDPASQPAG